MIPAYNAASTINETIESLQVCDGADLLKGVFLIDDASQDETAAIARGRWQSAVPFNICRNDVNLGERRTTNAGLERLYGDFDWALILHADDVVKRNWLSLYFDRIRRCADDVATICSSYDVWRPDTGEIKAGQEYPERPAGYVAGTRAAVIDTLRSGCWWHISGCAIRIQAFQRIGNFRPDIPMLADWEWLLRCLASGYAVEYIPRSTMLSGSTAALYQRRLCARRKI